LDDRREDSVEVADLFKVIGLNARLAMLPLLPKPLFSDGH